MTSSQTSRVVAASEYDALCELLCAVADECHTDPVPAIRREFGDIEADWCVRVIDGARSRELFDA